MKTTMTRMVALSLVCLGTLANQVRADEGLFGGVDLLFLAPKISDNGIYNIFNYGNTAVLSSNGNLDNELQFAQRVSLGYEGDNGGGVQVRWFTFENDLNYFGNEDHGAGLVALNGLTHLDIDAIDAELIQRGSFNYWDWMATAGVRWAQLSLIEDSIIDIDWEQFADFAWIGDAGVTFDGVGPTVSVSGIRPIFWDGFGIFGAARTALLYGNLEQMRYFQGRYINHNEMVQVWEVQAGIEIEREYDNFDLVLRTFWEAQRWDSESNMLGDIGLHGFGTYVGIEY